MKNIDKKPIEDMEFDIEGLEGIPLYEGDEDYIDESLILRKEKKKRLYPAS